MPYKKLGLIAILASVAAGNIFADVTNYAVGDVLLSFRKTSGANDLVVDAGPISTFTNATLNQRIPITQFTGTQLGAALNTTNGVVWSAFAYFDDTVSPNWTIYMTRPRAYVNQNIQTTPWAAGSSGGQSSLVNLALSTVAPGANANYGAGLNNPSSSSTAVIEPDSSSGYTIGQSYHTAVDPSNGGDDNWGNTFSGSPENLTTNLASVSRSDFYWIPATGSGSVVYLGYFELSNNAAMVFVGKPTAVPLLKTFSRTNGVATLTYKTGIYGTYSLLGTNKLSRSFSTWPVVGAALSTGDNLTHSVQDTDSVSNKFYILQGQ
jgi:hypothetical protein